jgi:hypothetical protein
MEPAEGMRCALCGAVAHVHCAADAAFLCAACDAQVHGANFLASRHRRTRVSTSKNLGHDHDVSGTSSTSCLSTADSATTTAVAAQPERRRKHTRTRRGRGEAVLEGWAKKMGLVAPGAARRVAPGAARRVAPGAARRVAPAASRALQDMAGAPRMPLRVAMAATLWREVTELGVREAHGGEALRRLEACARVPARLVVAVASSIGRAGVKRLAVMDTKEGWGECS